MKVWLLQRAEPTPHDNAGAQRRLRTGLMADFFQAAGHEVVWFTSSFDHYNRRLRYDETTTKEVRPGYDICYLKARGYKRNASIARLLDERAVTTEFRRVAPTKQRPDLIISSLPSVGMAEVAGELAQKWGVPMITDVRDLWPDVFLDLLPSFAKPFAMPMISSMRRELGKVIDASSAVIASSDALVQWAFAYSSRTRRSEDRSVRMAYMPSEALTISPSEEAEFQKKFAINPDEFNILFVGTIGPMMNLDPVLRASEILAAEGLPSHFRLCGHGSDLDRISTAAKGLPNVTCPGWVSAKEIRFLLGHSTAGIIPYSDIPSFQMSISNKFGEYLSGSLVMLANKRESAMGTLVTENGAGIVYDDDPVALANAIRRLHGSPEQLERHRHGAKKLYDEQFHGPTVYSRFVKDMENLAHNHSSNLR